MSQQGQSFRAEDEKYSRKRQAEGLTSVSYRNWLRQWRRSAAEHTIERGEPAITSEKEGKGGKGGVTPPPPPAKRRQSESQGGVTPLAVKAS